MYSTEYLLVQCLIVVTTVLGLLLLQWLTCPVLVARGNDMPLAVHQVTITLVSRWLHCQTCICYEIQLSVILPLATLQFE